MPRSISATPRSPHPFRASFGLTPANVTATISTQNTQVPVGQVGARPAVSGQELNIIVQGRTTLTTVEDFENILLRVNLDGSRVLLRDVARIELGGQSYRTQARVNGRPSAAVAIRLAPTANALVTAKAVRAQLADLAKFFPPGVRVDYPLDASAFIQISIEEVSKPCSKPSCWCFFGNPAGFDFWLHDLGNMGHERFLAARDQLIVLRVRRSVLSGASSAAPNPVSSIVGGNSKDSMFDPAPADLFHRSYGVPMRDGSASVPPPGTPPPRPTPLDCRAAVDSARRGN